jgi:hypothetical protein
VLADDDDGGANRMAAVDKILTIRQQSSYSEQSIREFRPPHLKVSATMLPDLLPPLDEYKFETPLMRQLSIDELEKSPTKH